MSFFKRKERQPKHEHCWEILHSKSMEIEYVRGGWFIKPFEFKRMALAQLKRCRSCQLEVSSITEQPPKVYLDIRDVPEGIGDVDPSWYRSKFGITEGEQDERTI